MFPGGSYFKSNTRLGKLPVGTWGGLTALNEEPGCIHCIGCGQYTHAVLGKRELI